MTGSHSSAIADEWRSSVSDPKVICASAFVLFCRFGDGEVTFLFLFSSPIWSSAYVRPKHNTAIGVIFATQEIRFSGDEGRFEESWDVRRFLLNFSSFFLIGALEPRQFDVHLGGLHYRGLLTALRSS